MLTTYAGQLLSSFRPGDCPVRRPTSMKLCGLVAALVVMTTVQSSSQAILAESHLSGDESGGQHSSAPTTPHLTAAGSDTDMRVSASGSWHSGQDYTDSAGSAQHECPLCARSRLARESYKQLFLQKVLNKLRLTRPPSVSREQAERFVKDNPVLQQKKLQKDQPAHISQENLLATTNMIYIRSEKDERPGDALRRRIFRFNLESTMNSELELRDAYLMLKLEDYASPLEQNMRENQFLFKVTVRRIRSRSHAESKGVTMKITKANVIDGHIYVPVLQMIERWQSANRHRASRQRYFEMSLLVHSMWNGTGQHYVTKRSSLPTFGSGSNQVNDKQPLLKLRLIPSETAMQNQRDSLPDDMCQPRRNDSGAERQTQACCRDSMEIDFFNIGWYFVLTPKSHNPFFCAGSCNHMVMASNAATQLTRMSTDDLDSVTCCSPQRFSSLNMVIATEDNVYRLVTVPEMSVERCGCV